MKIAQVPLDIAQEAVDRNVPGTSGFDTSNHGAGFGAWLSSLMSLAMALASLLVLFYLLWGAFEWITSSGDKGKLEKARQRMTGAVTGMIVLSAVTSLFILIQQFLGIQIFTFVGLGTGGNGGGGQAQSCTITGSPVSDGGAGDYCTQGAAMVQCVGPDAYLNYNHYTPCYCIEGSEYQRPGYDFGGC